MLLDHICVKSPRTPKGAAEVVAFFTTVKAERHLFIAVHGWKCQKTQLPLKCCVVAVLKQTFCVVRLWHFEEL